MSALPVDPGLFRPDSRLTPELAQRYVADGRWRDRTLGGYIRAAVARHPTRLAAVNYDGNGARGRSVTYAEFAELIARYAGGLSALGVGRGDVVSVMLPNRLEFGALIYAIAELGAIYSGIPVSYGPREASFMLMRAESRVLVIPERFRNREYVEFARDLRARQPGIRHVVVAGEAPAEPGWHRLDELERAAPLDSPRLVLPGSLVHVGFTSGTTSEPKGVMNTHQTLDAVIRGWVEHVGPTIANDEAVDLVASPVGHHTGFLWGVLAAAYLGGTAVYLDQWVAEAAASIVRAEGVTMMFFAPTFVQDLLRVWSGGPNTLRIIAVAGAPVPRGLPAEGRAKLGCFICPAWGMTEWGIGISGTPRLPLELNDGTDGLPIDGCEVRIVDAAGQEAPRGEEGALQIRGPGLFLGYYNRPDFTQAAFGPEGWFDTGDRAMVRPDGYVLLTGRNKDIVIRGGENIPVVEIESLLYRHPAVLDVAVVGYPDARLGERACAVVVARPGAALDFSAMVDYLLAEGLSRHFLPERLEIVDALPKTMSGKIRKVELREWLKGASTPD